MNFIVFDTEDDSEELLSSGRSGFDKQVTQIAAITSTGQTFHNRGDGVEFLKWLREQESQPIYAFNLQYDLGNIFGHALDKVQLRMIPGSSRLLRAGWCGLQFYDAMNLWPNANLAQIGKVFGIEKLAMDVHSEEYVMRDCEILVAALKMIMGICKDYKINKLPATIGGLAVKIWRSMNGMNWMDDSAYGRLAYFGGRVELFAKEKLGLVQYTDINSLYPSVMRQEYPTCAKPQKTIDCLGIAHVTIEVPECFIGPLPHRTDEGRIVYPWGTFKGVWTCSEIQNAVNQGATVLKLHGCDGSKEGKYYYRDFVNHFYELRLKSTNYAKNEFYKRLLNNLYGQLGMSGKLSLSTLLTDDDFDAMTGEYTGGGTVFGEQHLIDRQFPLQEHVNRFHAAQVTSYGRIALDGFLRKVNQKHLLYCDTDSIIFDGQGGIPFPIGKELGMMKLEGTAKVAVTFAPKTYKFDDKYKAKGVRRSHAKEFIETGHTSFPQPFKLREACAFFDAGNSHRLSVWRDCPREFGAVYDRKTWDAKNKCYRPKRVVDV